MEINHVFQLGDGNSFVRVNLNELLPDSTFGGGYNCKGAVEVDTGWFRAKGAIWIETGELYRFYQALRSCYELLNGAAKFTNEDGTLELVATFSPKRGHVVVKGICRQEHYQPDNVLTFMLELDQSYVAVTLAQLSAIVAGLGDGTVVT